MKGTPLTDHTCEYIVSNFASDERVLLQRMSARAQAAGIPMIMIAEEQAKFVKVFLRAIKAKRVLDVGTLFGYSAAIMSQAIGADGEVVSLEFNPEHAEVAKENLAEAGIGNVKVITGPALDAMKSMKDNIFDFVLIDADKVNYVNYLRESLRLVRPGGVIAGDNALALGKIATEVEPDDSDFVSVTALQEFNRAITAEPSLFSILAPIGDGMVIGVVQK